MAKQTRLDDDAFIYQPRKDQTEKEKLSEMPFRKKIEYLMEYYKFHALVGLVVIAFVIYIVNTLLHPAASTQFYAAIINSTMDEQVSKQYSEDFSKYLKLNPSKESVEFSATYNFDLKDSYSSQLREVLVTRISAKQVDVIIAPESEFYNYCYAGGFLKLSDLLPTDLYSSLTDKFYTTHTQYDADQTAYGIYLKDTPLKKYFPDDSQNYVMGIVSNSEHVDNSISFIQFLFNKK